MLQLVNNPRQPIAATAERVLADLAHAGEPVWWRALLGGRTCLLTDADGRQVQVQCLVSRSVPGHVLASTFFEADGRVAIWLSRGTRRGIEAGEADALFTLAHELGHVVQHRDVAARLDRMRNGSDAELAWVEHEADLFASAFLALIAGGAP